jgi:uncharacterized coiled-coil protein SlyX
MKIAGLKKELRRRDRRIEELLETIRQQGETIDRQAIEIDSLAKRLAELEATLNRRVEANASKKPSFVGNYSLSRQQERRNRKQKSPGRRPNLQKLEMVGLIVSVHQHRSVAGVWPPCERWTVRGSPATLSGETAAVGAAGGLPALAGVTLGDAVFADRFGMLLGPVPRKEWFVVGPAGQ